jgi:arabinofuranosyltransferase
MDLYKKPFYKTGLFLFLLILSAISTYLYWHKYGDPLYGIDDANIYFVYMRNLARGNGFVYNVGGEHVEGYTSFLWVLLGSIFYIFTSKPEISLMLFNVFLLTLTIWRACLFVDYYLSDRRMISPYTLLLSSFIFLVPGYVQWTTITIMETGLWSCLLVFLFLGILQNYMLGKRGSFATNFFLVLLLITRPEGYLWGGVAIAIQFFLLYNKTRSFKIALKPTLISLLVFSASIGALTTFRMIYFGYPYPNTYYAKISSDYYTNFKGGNDYVNLFLSYCRLHIVLPIIATIMSIFALLRSKKNAIILFAFPVIIILVYLIPFYTGGDHFGLFRFFQPYIPLFCVFYMIAFFTMMPLKKWFWYLPVAASMVLIFFSFKMNFNNFIKNKNNIQVEFWIATAERQYAEELNSFLQYQEPLPSNGVFVAGSSAYTYKGKTIDLLGLNNVAMAHSSRTKTGLKNHGSFSKEVFYEQMPDLFFCTRVHRDTSRFDYKDVENFKHDQFIKKVFKGLFDEQKFKETYFPVFIFSKKDKSILQTHTHKGFLNKLDTTVYSYEMIEVN